MPVTIYHNPRCSKSRETLALLKERGIEPRIVDYLKDPPSAAVLKDLIKKLGLPAVKAMRTKEQTFKDLGLNAASLSDADAITAMAAHPVLIERPIVVNGAKAALGRPPEAVLDIL